MDYSDPDSFAISKKGRVIVVDGDTYVGGRAPDVSGESLSLFLGGGGGGYSDPDSFALSKKGRVIVVDADTSIRGRAADIGSIDT